MDLDDPCMPELLIDARNFFLACYLVSNVQGETILGSTIRHATLRQYLTAAVKLFNDRKIPTSSYDSINYVDMILKAVRDYERVPNRRNMITDDMMVYLLQLAQADNKDGSVAAIVDWIILGRYTGFRMSEWAQSTQTKYAKIDHWPNQPPMAMIYTDFVFLGEDQRRIHINKNTTYEELLESVEYVEIQWRHQKNKDHGQKIPFARDRINNDYCPVLAAIRIAMRVLRLNAPKEEPLAIFKHYTKGKLFITDNMVQKLLRKVAQKVMNIKDKSELQKWSTHSIRVTAANLLHREKFADTFIQTRLRWKSLSFLTYLRNTIYSASLHTCALRISNSNLPPKVERVYREDEPHEQVTSANYTLSPPIAEQ